jgi:D-aspartate ligase
MKQGTAFVLTHRSNANRRGYSASFQALQMTRSLGRRGVPVVRVHPGRRELSLYSRYCSSVEDSPNVHESEAALLEFLLDLAQKYEAPRVLLPASDDTVHFLGRYREPLLAAYRIPAPGCATIETIIDKRSQYAAAQALGIPIPETHFPAGLAEVEAFAGTLCGYPYIIKPNVAHHWRLASVKEQLSSEGATTKAVLVRDAEELLAEYRQISQVDPAVMIQRVIGGGDERLFCFYGYFDERSRPLGCCVRRKLRQLPLRFGYSTLMESCENETVVQQSVRLLQGLHYHGIVGVEWKHDPESGEYKLIEINARATNAVALPIACGVDLPYLAFADALGEPLAPVTRWKTGVKWLWFTADLWAARQLMQRGELKFGEWLRSLRGKKVYPVYAADDILPFLVELGVFVKSQITRAARRFLAVATARRKFSWRPAMGRAKVI